MACSDCFGKCIGCDANGLPEYQGPLVPVLTVSPPLTITSTPSGECGVNVALGVTIPPPVSQIQYIKQGNFNFAPFYDPGAGGTPTPGPLGSLSVASGPVGTITNPDPLNSAIIVGSGQSDAICALETPVPDLDRSFSIELQVSFDAGGTWQKIHENGWTTRSKFATGLADTIEGRIVKNVEAQGEIGPGASITLLYRVMVNDFNISAAAVPPQVALKIANFQWRLWTAENVT